MLVDESKLFLLAARVFICNAVISRRNCFHSTSASRNHKRVTLFFSPFSHFKNFLVKDAKINKIEPFKTGYLCLVIICGFM